jgi:hypothetical protein
MQKKLFPGLHLHSECLMFLHSRGVGFAAALLLAFPMGCSRTSTSTYPELEATLTLLAKQDSVAIRYPAWASSGMVYYVAYPENGDSTELREHDPVTGAVRVIAKGVTGPIAVAADGKIAALQAAYRIIVYDSSGAEIWAMNVGASISTIAFSADADAIYYCKNGMLLLISIGSSFPHDTIMEEITAFSKSPNDSIFIYCRITPANGDSLHTFYRYEAASGEQSIILQEGFSSGFSLSPASTDELAVGVTTDNGQLLARQILLLHINHGIGRIFESSPYDHCYLRVSSWDPEGTALLITVTPFVEGDPTSVFPDEIWIAKDMY